MALGVPSAYTIAPKDDVLAVRQQALATEADEYIQCLTEYGQYCLSKCSDGRKITPELQERMKMLVNQEYRVFNVCQSVLKVCKEIERACEDSADVPAEVLDPLLDELAEYFSDAHEYVQQRRDNIDKIMDGERESMQEFQKLKMDIDTEKSVVTVGGVCGVVAGVAVSGPIGAAAAIVSVLVMAGHRLAANKVQEGLSKDLQRINAPIQYMETLKANFDDTMVNADLNRSKLAAGRSARIIRRMDTVLEEVEVLRRSACRNFLALAGNQTLASGLGITESRRLAKVLQEVAHDSAKP